MQLANEELKKILTLNIFSIKRIHIHETTHLLIQCFLVFLISSSVYRVRSLEMLVLHENEI